MTNLGFGDVGSAWKNLLNKLTGTFSSTTYPNIFPQQLDCMRLTFWQHLF